MSKFVAKHEERLRPQIERTPLRRFGQPEDVADVIAYALNTPGHVNLDLITMRPVAQSAQHLLARGPLHPRLPVE
jgi:NADP-dependent 3-hydroxy acid dehydrogenase YdfG